MSSKLKAYAALIGLSLLSYSCGNDVGAAPGAQCASLENYCSLSAEHEQTPELGFNELHQRIFLPTCASAESSCHSNQHARGGLSFEDAEGAYTALLHSEAPRVVPGAPECSLLVLRLEHPGRSVMPPTGPLPEAERCAIRAWIERGAPQD